MNNTIQYFNNMKRIYKEDTPNNTILKIKKILCDLGIITYESFIANPYPNIHSCRLQTIESQGNFGQNGKGRTFEYSLASAHAEFMERLQNGFYLGGGSLSLPLLKKIKQNQGFYFYPDEKTISKEELLSLNNKFLTDIFGGTSTKDTRSLIEKYFNRLKQNGERGVIAVPFYDYTNKKVIYLPYNITMMITGSNGMAAGNTIAESIFQAICEIFERKAATSIYYERLTPPTISKEYLKQYEKLYKTITEIETKGYDVIVKDFSLGKKMPVLGTIIIDKKSQKYRLNVGADTSFEIALSRTLTEIHQGLKDQQAFKAILLTVPKTEHFYFIDNSEESQKKRFEEISKFKVNGSGVFPKSLFDDKESYSFNPETFSEKATYKDEVKYLLNLITELGEDVYIRNSSFLGFPTSYVYVTEMSLLGKKGAKIVSTANIDIDTHLSNDELEKLFYNFYDFFKDKGKLERLLNHFPVAEFKNKKDNSMAELLKLEFTENFYWNKLPVSFYLTISSFLLKRYNDTIEYLQKYLKTMNIENSKYYMNVIEYLKLLNEGKDENYIKTQIDNVIINNFKEDILINAIEHPMCPECDTCKLKKFCLTKEKLSIYERITDYMKNSNIKQDELKELV